MFGFGSIETDEVQHMEPLPSQQRQVSKMPSQVQK